MATFFAQPPSGKIQFMPAARRSEGDCGLRAGIQLADSTSPRQRSCVRATSKPRTEMVFVSSAVLKDSWYETAAKTRKLLIPPRLWPSCTGWLLRDIASPRLRGPLDPRASLGRGRRDARHRHSNGAQARSVTLWQFGGIALGVGISRPCPRPPPGSYGADREDLLGMWAPSAKSGCAFLRSVSEDLALQCESNAPAHPPTARRLFGQPNSEPRDKRGRNNGCTHLNARAAGSGSSHRPPRRGTDVGCRRITAHKRVLACRQLPVRRADLPL